MKKFFIASKVHQSFIFDLHLLLEKYFDQFSLIMKIKNFESLKCLPQNCRLYCKYAMLCFCLVLLLPSCRHKIGEGVKVVDGDILSLAEGLKSKVLISAGDTMNDSVRYGYDNSGLALIAQGSGDAMLWVGFESVNALLVSGYDKQKKYATRDRLQLRMETELSGGAFLKVERFFGRWQVEEDNSANRRIAADEEILFEWNEPLRGAQKAKGTVAHGQAIATPWNTVLSCENNYFYFYAGQNYAREEFVKSELGWESFNQIPSTHFGYIVEIDPSTGIRKKHVALGRFPHGGISLVPLQDGRVVIYTSDNRSGGCIYKFISDEPDQIYPGTLFVANMEERTWKAIDYSEGSDIFTSATDMMIKTAKAANIVGGTPLAFPAGITYNRGSDALLIAIQGDSINNCGQILSLIPDNGDHTSLSFEFEEVVSTAEGKFCRPTNLILDKNANIWFTTKIRNDELWSDPMAGYGNNGLFVRITKGARAGEILRVATAPSESNFGGICFSPNGKTLFATIQSVGARSKAEEISSKWNKGEGVLPRPALVSITGGLFSALQEVE